MSDIEKTPAQVTQPPSVEAASPRPGRITGLIKGTIVNDLNVLGKDMLQKALEYDEAQLERDAVKVRKKLDFLVLPMVHISHFTPSHTRLGSVAKDCGLTATILDDVYLYAKLPRQTNVGLPSGVASGCDTSVG